VAEALQTSTRTVRRFIATGDLSAIHIGRLVRVDPDALAAFLAERAVSDRSRK